MLLLDVVLMHDVFWLEADHYPNFPHANSMLAIYLIGQHLHIYFLWGKFWIVKINSLWAEESTKQIIASILKFRNLSIWFLDVLYSNVIYEFLFFHNTFYSFFIDDLHLILVDDFFYLLTCLLLCCASLLF